MVPESFEELEKLPGVGPKTASVVICTAFGSVLAHAKMCWCITELNAEHVKL